MRSKQCDKNRMTEDKSHINYMTAITSATIDEPFLMKCTLSVDNV